MKREEKEKCKKLRHLVFKFSDCVRAYKMISEGDRVLVCFSGGKDSFVLFELLKEYKKRTKEKFKISAVHIDHSIPEFPVDKLENFLKQSGVEYFIVKQDIFGTIKEKLKKSEKACSLCSRLRRGAIYKFASENGFNKIALGHHMDDVVETLFLNMFYGSKLKAMPPVLFSRDKGNITIRPMSQIREKEIEKYSETVGLPVIQKNFCGIAKNIRRNEIKEMLKKWDIDQPGRVEKIYSSIKKIEPELLSDPKLFNFFIPEPF